MKTNIVSIENRDTESVQITAIVYWHGLPRPNYEANETDEQYAARVEPVAKELNGYNNLHLGWAELQQELVITNIPKVNEYDT